MKIVPLTLAEANALVMQWHRHHKKVQGHRFSIGAKVGDELVGAAIVGRPVARSLDWHKVAEVTRLVTNGHKNACSFLYSAVARICREMGYERVQTYILGSEPGTSLLAAGWHLSHRTSESHRWTNRANRRSDQPVEAKQCWVKDFSINMPS